MGHGNSTNEIECIGDSNMQCTGISGGRRNVLSRGIIIFISESAAESATWCLKQMLSQVHQR